MARKPSPSRPSLPLLAAGLVVCAGLLMAPTLTRAMSGGPEPSAAPAAPSVTPVAPSVATPPPSALAAAQSAQPTAEPGTEPAASSAPTSSGSFDYSQPAPASGEVDLSYFSDALFIGDSRTEGLELYSGISQAEGVSFYCYKGITVFDVMEQEPKKLIELGGSKYSIVDALSRESGKYKKVYLSLGVNELGYYDDQGFHDKFAALIDRVRETQPDAVIYLQNLAPVDPIQCAKNWPSYVNNEKVHTYNQILRQLAEEKKVVLLDIFSALGDPDGVLDTGNTVDGVHFTKAWYQTWLAYLRDHVVDPSQL